MTETVSSALQRGLDDDYSTLEQELDDFLTDELDKQVPLPSPGAAETSTVAPHGKTHAPVDGHNTNHSRVDNAPTVANHMQPRDPPAAVGAAGWDSDTAFAALAPPPFPRASRTNAYTASGGRPVHDTESDGVVRADTPLLAAV
eukprot:30176-Rhodomonas_salina.2